MQEASTIIANHQSGLKGEIDQNLIENILSAAKNAETKGLIKECLSDFEDFAGDTIYHKGAMKISGHFNTFQEQLYNIVIDGDLYVDGAMITYDDPRTLVFVTGNLYVNNLVNSGHLIVNGDLRVKNALIGDYNQGNVTVFGKTKAALFYPETHSFTLKGAIDFDYAFGNSYRLNENEHKALFNFNSADFHKALSHLHPDFVELIDLKTAEAEEYAEAIVEYIKWRDLLDYVKKDNPILKQKA